MKSNGHSKPLFILELANNHMGELAHGLRVVRECAAVTRELAGEFEFAFKLQYRHLDTFIHPAYRERKDVKLVDRFQSTRLTDDEFRALKDAAQTEGFKTMCTPFDEPSVDRIEAHGFDYVKIASCSFSDWPLLERLARVDKPFVASVGGALEEEIDAVVSFFHHRQKSLAVLHCVAEYPVPPERLALSRLDLLRRRYPHLRVGFSSHEPPEETYGVVLAMSRGASVFERHVAVATERYPRNAYSVTPAELRLWLQAAHRAWTICRQNGDGRAANPEERRQLRALQRGAFARTDLPAGQMLGPEHYFLAFPAVPGQVVANQCSKYVTFKITAPIAAQAPILEQDLEITDRRAALTDALGEVKMLLKKGRIILPTTRPDLEISHHYGMDKFPECGAVLLNVVNREYCKKLIAMLPGQRHPEHYHQQKEETFYVVHGEMTLCLNGADRHCQAGDQVLVPRGTRHSFRTTDGVIFEEISSTHFVNDSYYVDPQIMQNQQRKTVLTHWMD